MSIPPEVQHFFGRFPAARDAYAAQPLYHQTHSRYLPGIMAEGLRPNHSLFPPEQGGFLLQMYKKYATYVVNEQVQYIQDRIISSSIAYLSAVHPDEAFMDYSVPERLTLLMRSMAALANKTSLTEAERAYAARSFAEHKAALTEGNPRSITLQVNPLAPSAVNSRLAPHNLAEVTNEEDATSLVHYVDGNYQNNISVREPIEPAHIQVAQEIPLTHTALLSITKNVELGWTRDIA